MNVELAIAGLGYNVASVSWQSDLQKGYVSHYSDFCGSMAPVARGGTGVQGWPGPMTLDGRTWRVEQDFFVPATPTAGRGAERWRRW